MQEVAEAGSVLAVETGSFNLPRKKKAFCLAGWKRMRTFATANEKDGGIAQLVRAHDS